MNCNLQISNTLFSSLFYFNQNINLDGIWDFRRHCQALHSLPSKICKLSFILTLTYPSHTFFPFFVPQTPAQVAELHSQLDFALPFGKPQITDSDTVRMCLQQGFPSDTLVNRVPGWRPIWPARGRPRVEFVIKEYIQSSQYDRKGIEDVCTATGTIHAHIEAEGGLAEVTMNLANPGNNIASFSMHNCIQLDSEIIDAAGSTFKFVPPPAPFVLGTYTVAAPIKPPFRGFYQMKEETPTKVMFLLQLKLESFVSNSFQVFEAVLPFKGRGAITSLQKNPSTGTVTVGSDKQSLVWNIGQKVSASNLEMSLSGTVAFDGIAVAGPEASDPFCTGLTCYAKIKFKIPRWTIGTCVIDPKKVSLTPLGKNKLTVSVESMALSRDYIIWNSRGDSKHVAPLKF